jgi:dihydroneopterin aldolase
MLSVCLKNLVFFSFHGLYPEEKLVGGKFIVNVNTSFIPSGDPVQVIGETLNYEVIFRIVCERMNTPTDLIETVAMHIVSDIRHSFSGVLKVNVSIEKCNPPIKTLEGSVLVEYSWCKTGVDNG